MKRLWLFALSSLLLSACGGTPISSSSSESSSSENVAESLSFSQKNEETSSLSSSEEPESSSSSAISSAPLEELDYETLWDYGEAVSLSLSATPEAMYAFSRYGSDNSFTKYRDVYFPADFVITVNGQTYVYEDVGIRMKGNTSRASICDASGVLNGDYCHFKISFKETFDDSIYNESALQAFKRDWSSNEAGRKARKKRTLAGMKKIDLKYCPRNEGKCYNQEIYAYDCFRKAGIPAINAKWATLTLNSGTSTWTASYEAVECYDKTFLSRYFPGDDEGDLYKCGQVVTPSQTPYGGNTATYADFALDGAVAKSVDASGYQSGTRIANGKIGIEDSYNGYHPNYDLKTNDDAGEGSDFSKMASLINAAYACRYNSAPLSLLESVLDLDWFLKYEAYAYLLGNYDDGRNNYNNFYVYFRSNGKAVFLPYDYDYAFGAMKTNGTVSPATYGPLHQKDSHNNLCKNNLYWDTILTNASLSYDQSQIQTDFRTLIQEGIDADVLDYANYTTFIATLAGGLSTASEKSAVQTYMTQKLAKTNA